MKKQKSQSGSMRLIIIIVLVVALLGVLGFVYWLNFMQQKPKVEDNIVQKTDQELVIQAVGGKGLQKADGSKVTPTDVVVAEVVGNNAKGTLTTGGEYGGSAFIANKSDGIWLIIYIGQQLPGKDVGAKYGLPDGWYDTSYDTVY